MPFRPPGCFCLPEADFVCKRCQELGQEPNENFKLEAENEPDLSGYGYKRADQDGYDGGSVSPIDHKEEEFFAAAKQILHAQGITEQD